MPFTFAQWCQSEAITLANLTATQLRDRFKEYLGKYVKDEIERTEKGIGKIDFSQQVIAIAAETYWTTKEAVANATTVAAKIGVIDAFTNALNDVQSYIPKKVLEDSSVRYGRKGGWTGINEALEALISAATVSALPVRTAKPGQGGPDIPGITWAEAQARFPPSLVNLIDDIHRAHRLNVVIDERNRAQLGTKDDAPDTPGALRSWHWNQDGALPDLTVPGGLVSALHNHYTANSVGPFNGKGALGGPIGYAEYTGNAIVDDKHNCKLVYDYVNDVMYVTVTHYQRYDVDNGQGVELKDKYKVQDKKTGSQSAWFYIRF